MRRDPWKRGIGILAAFTAPDSHDLFVGGDLSPEQRRRLAIESGRYGSLVLLLGTVGLRWGEAAALRVGDVEFLHWASSARTLLRDSWD
jgi:hypothetical protein